MRRKDREITNRNAIDEIILRCRVCRMGLCDNGQPYVIPLSFGYDGQSFYFHMAFEGRKIEVLQRNSRVCIEFDILNELIESDKACNWGMKYESVIGFGTAEFIDSLEPKRKAVEVIMKQYSAGNWSIDEQMLSRIKVIRVRVEELTCKSRQ